MSASSQQEKSAASGETAGRWTGSEHGVVDCQVLYKPELVLHRLSNAAGATLDSSGHPHFAIPVAWSAAWKDGLASHLACPRSSLGQSCARCGDAPASHPEQLVERNGRRKARFGELRAQLVLAHLFDL